MSRSILSPVQIASLGFPAPHPPTSSNAGTSPLERSPRSASSGGGHSGLTKPRDYLGQHVVAAGWFRRSPGPVIEVREVRAAGGQTARAWWYPLAYGLSALVLLTGLVVTLVGIAGG
jgi:hypothetical protein